jgi:hypothetical protein
MYRHGVTMAMTKRKDGAEGEVGCKVLLRLAFLLRLRNRRLWCVFWCLSLSWRLLVWVIFELYILDRKLIVSTYGFSHLDDNLDAVFFRKFIYSVLKAPSLEITNGVNQALMSSVARLITDATRLTNQISEIERSTNQIKFRSVL